MEGLEKKFEKFTIAGNWKIVGSAGTRGIVYWSDVDVEDHLHGRASTLARHFQEMASLQDDLIFLELKCGIDKRYQGDARKIRWNRKQVAQGYKIKSGKKFLLSTCISDNSILKLDLAVPYLDRWFDVSIRYFYQQKSEKEEDIVQELENDVDEYKGVDTLKALKRLYSVFKLKHHASAEKCLVDFFNSRTGFLNKQRSDLELLQKINGNVDDQVNQIRLNLQTILPKHIRSVQGMIDYLRKRVEKEAQTFLKINAEKLLN